MKNGVVLAVGCFMLVGLSWLLAIIGVLRGFSIQMPIVIYFPLVVGLALLPIRMILLKKVDSVFWFGFISVVLFFAVTHVLFFLQFRLAKEGNQLLEKGLYRQALKPFQAVYENRYLQFGYNIKAISSQMNAAKCYCQMGDFEEASNLYLLAEQRYSGTYQRIAKDRVRDINEGLRFVADFKSDADENALLELARVYRYKLFCGQKAAETYRKVIEVTDSDRIQKLAEEEIEEINKRGSSGEQ